MMQRLRNLLLTTTALMPFALGAAFAGPNGATVVGGSASVQNPGSANVTVNQFSDKAIINWRMFDIGAGERTTFVQPNSSSVILNRVTGGMGPSQILGSLDANGKVFVVNRDGIIFGAGAVINTAGFLATTSDIKNADFMAGRYQFQIPGRGDASIVNMGTITATSGGFAALVAPGVRNSGTITATLGSIGLASANSFSLDFYGDKLITLGVGDQIAADVKDVATGKTLKSLVSNEGQLKANGGRVELTAAAARQVVDSVINTSGVIEANSVGVKDGQIVLGAATAASKPADAPAQNVRVSGSLSAAGKQKGTRGGSITVTGEHITVAGATIKATGREGGGKVLIGGDWGGGRPDASLVSNGSAKLESHAIPTATSVSVDAATRIDASATRRGDGGKVVLWADDHMSFAGTILALGGTQFGNGGFVETSGKRQLDFTGNVDLKAANGSFGTLLLDPTNMSVSTNPDNATFVNGTFSAGNSFSPSNVNVTTLTSALSSANVVVTTGGAGSPGTDAGDIFVNAPIVWNAATTLTLSAFHNVNVAYVGGLTGAIRNTGGGSLILRADNSGTGSGTVILNAGTDSNRIVWGSTGSVAIYYNPGNGFTSPVDYASTTNTGLGGGFGGRVVVPNSSQLTAYMLVNSSADLTTIGTSAATLGEKYAIGPAILDATNFAGFAPGITFTGILTGNGGLGTISKIDSLSGRHLFPFIGTAGKVRDLDFTNVNIDATANNQFIGAVAGQNDGTITNVRVLSGSVDGHSFSGIVAGGMVGQNTGNLSIHNSSSAASVVVGDGTSGSGNSAGGLAGSNSGTIANSSASGAVSGGASSFIGGLVGRSDNGTITGSSATGNVAITAANAFGTTAGGLAGFNSANSSITGSSASGNVSTNAGGFAGGVVGQNEGQITSSTRTGGIVSGTGSSGLNIVLGGLVGTNNNSGQISNSSASGAVNLGAFGNAGGLVGANNNVISNSSSSATVTATGINALIGGLVGNNSPGATITNSRASGNVTSAFNATGMFDFTAAGGLVGNNSGTITATGAPPTVSTLCAAGASCATGNVSVGAHGSGGGLVGFNLGAITSSFATGAVTGAAGLGNNIPTNIGGLAGFNAGPTGTITGSHARGNVGSNLAHLSAGGLAGDNTGTISGSFATGNVTVGSESQAGGLVGSNGGDCVGCTGNITNASASGTVTAGAASFAGGLVGGTGDNNSFTNTSASGAVTGGADSVIGGLIGALGPGATITNSNSSGSVSSTAANVMAGGLAGISFGTITGNSSASGTVSVATESYAGGLVGGNLGRIESAFTALSATVTGTGNRNILGGLVSANFGTITLSTAAGAVNGAGGSFGAAGGLVGANVVMTGVPPGLTLAGSSFPSGTITNSSATGTVTGGQFGHVGGLIGQNGGAISGLTSSVNVSGGDGSTVGGLVGVNSGPVTHPALPAVLTACGGCNIGSASSAPGSIANSSASGNVTGGNSGTLGGLVGSNPGSVSGSSASGIVTGGALMAGGLVGLNDFGGSIAGSSATGAVTGAFVVGGLAGLNNGVIAGSQSSGAVTGTIGSTAGGFAGMNVGSIADSNASGNVTGGEGSTLGGLVGGNIGQVTNSFATGAVIADPSLAGGLIGMNLGIITGSWASGAVSGDAGSMIAGLVAFNIAGTIQNSYSVSNVTVGDGGIAAGLVAVNFGAVNKSFATGAVTGGANSYVGGLVAYNFGDGGVSGAPVGTILQSYATGAVTGGEKSVVAGLVAENAGSIDQSYAAGLVTGGPGSITGGLVASNNFSTPAAVPASLPPGGSTTPGTTTNSYWDRQTTGQTTSAGGTPQSTAQLTTGVPSGFDSSAWNSGGGTNYPSLAGQPNPLPVPGQPVLPAEPPPPPPPPPDPTPPPTVDPIQPPTTVDNQNNPPQLSPQLIVAANLLQDNLIKPPAADAVINTAPPANNPPPSGSSGGGGNTRPAITQVPALGLGPLPSGMPALNETRFLANEVVMQLGTVMTAETVAALAREFGLDVLAEEDFGLLGRKVYRFRITNGRPVRDLIAAMERNRINVSVQPSFVFTLGQTGVAPAETGQGDSAQYIVSKLRLPQAHAIATGSNVRVAVIDSGIDGAHPDLQGVITASYDALPSNDQTPHPHGTGMAGAIASHNRLLGVAPGARLLAIRAFGVNNEGAQGTSMNIVKGLEWAVKQGAKVINMSFAGPRDPLLQQAIKQLTDQGIILIAAAGNAGPKSPPLYPGADPNVIAVSATDVDDKTYKNANRGKYVAIAAPGVDILVPAPDGGYQLTTGTSVAAAHISGVAALLLERDPQLKPSEVRSILTSTAKNIGPNRNDVGAGLVDPVQALTRAAPRSAAAR